MNEDFQKSADRTDNKIMAFVGYTILCGGFVEKHPVAAAVVWALPLAIYAGAKLLSPQSSYSTRSGPGGGGSGGG